MGIWYEEEDQQEEAKPENSAVHAELLAFVDRLRAGIAEETRQQLEQLKEENANLLGIVCRMQEQRDRIRSEFDAFKSNVAYTEKAIARKRIDELMKGYLPSAFFAVRRYREGKMCNRCDNGSVTAYLPFGGTTRYSCPCRKQAVYYACEEVKAYSNKITEDGTKAYFLFSEYQINAEPIKKYYDDVPFEEILALQENVPFQSEEKCRQFAEWASARAEKDRDEHIATAWKNAKMEMIVQEDK